MCTSSQNRWSPLSGFSFLINWNVANECQEKPKFAGKNLGADRRTCKASANSLKEVGYYFP